MFNVQMRTRPCPVVTYMVRYIVLLQKHARADMEHTRNIVADFLMPHTAF